MQNKYIKWTKIILNPKSIIPISPLHDPIMCPPTSIALVSLQALYKVAIINSKDEAAMYTPDSMMAASLVEEKVNTKQSEYSYLSSK